jgi:hypothetical protein
VGGTAPAATAKAKAKAKTTRAVLRQRGLAVTVTCAGPCRAALVLRSAAGARLATASARLTKAGRRTVVLRPSAAALRRLKPGAAKVAVTVTGGDGSRRTITLAVSIPR